MGTWLRSIARGLRVLACASVFAGLVQAQVEADHPQALALDQRAQELIDKGRYREALAISREALALREREQGPDHVGTSISWNDIGWAHRLLGENLESERAYRRALAVREKGLGPEHPRTSDLLNNLAILYRQMGRYGDAATLHRRALAIREKALGTDDSLTGQSLGNLGYVLYFMGRYEEAQQLMERALAITERTQGPNHRSTAARLNNLATLHEQLGRYEEALVLYRRALAIREQAFGREHDLTIESMNNLTGPLNKLGRLGESVAMLEEVLALSRRVRDPRHPGTATAMNNLAAQYRLLGRYEEAVALIEGDIAAGEAAGRGDSREAAMSINNLGIVRRDMGHNDEALRLFERTLAIREKRVGKEHAETAVAMHNLAGSLEIAGRLDDALSMHRRSLAIFEKTLGPTHADTGKAWMGAAGVHKRLGQPELALASYRRALQIASSAGEPELLWMVHRGLMRAMADQASGPALAIWHGKQAVNTLQTARGQIKQLDAASQRGFLERNAATYTQLAELLVRAGRIPEAEQVLAMLKEFELTELVRRGTALKVRVDDVGIERAVTEENARRLAEGASLSTELAELERRVRGGERLGSEDEARRQQLLQAAELWRAQFQQWLAGLAEQFARSGRSRQEASEQGQVGTRLQTLVRADPGAVGLHYIVGDERLAIIVSTARGSFGRTSAVSRAELNRQIVALRQAIVDRGDVLPAAQALYRLLIAPVAQDLRQARATTLVLSLTDTLRYLPFAALHDGRQFLIERHALALYASAGGARPQRSGLVWQVAGMGVTQPRLGFEALPSVRGELHGIVRTPDSREGVLAGTIVLDRAFDRGSFEQALGGGYSVVHVASHFSFTPGDEKRSLLLLGEGEPLSLGQLAVMDFSHVEQLTLSACDTALGGGANASGAEVEGLAAAVQAQGAQAVLASLWKVADASTATLMRGFYAARAGAATRSRAQALRDAQLALLRGDPTWAHPFFWAPFVLSGNWL